MVYFGVPEYGGNELHACALSLDAVTHRDVCFRLVLACTRLLCGVGPCSWLEYSSKQKQCW